MSSHVDDFPEGTAYHEAGHTAMTHLVRFHTRRVWLGAGGRRESLGGHKLVENANRFIGVANSPENQKNQVRSILICLAGPTAERIAANRPTFLTGYEHDKC